MNATGYASVEPSPHGHRLYASIYKTPELEKTGKFNVVRIKDKPTIESPSTLTLT